MALTHRPWAILWTLATTLFVALTPREARAVPWLYVALGVPAFVAAPGMLAGVAWLVVTLGIVTYRRTIRHEPPPVQPPPWPWFLRVDHRGTASGVSGDLLAHERGTAARAREDTPMINTAGDGDGDGERDQLALTAMRDYRHVMSPGLLEESKRHLWATRAHERRAWRIVVDVVAGVRHDDETPRT